MSDRNAWDFATFLYAQTAKVPYTQQGALHAASAVHDAVSKARLRQAQQAHVALTLKTAHETCTPTMAGVRGTSLQEQGRCKAGPQWDPRLFCTFMNPRMPSLFSTSAAHASAPLYLAPPVAQRMVQCGALRQDWPTAPSWRKWHGQARLA